MTKGCLGKLIKWLEGLDEEGCANCFLSGWNAEGRYKEHVGCFLPSN